MQQDARGLKYSTFLKYSECYQGNKTTKTKTRTAEASNPIRIILLFLKCQAYDVPLVFS